MRALPATLMRPALPQLLSGRLPCFYGWIVLGCLCCAGFSRQGPAVATLSIFVEPLTREFGWSRTALSGAVSLGGVQAGLVAMPLIAQLAIVHQGWRAGWLAIGAATLVIGFVPVWLLLVRRPEDLGLL